MTASALLELKQVLPTPLGEELTTWADTARSSDRLHILSRAIGVLDWVERQQPAGNDDLKVVLGSVIAIAQEVRDAMLRDHVEQSSRPRPRAPRSR